MSDHDTGYRLLRAYELISLLMARENGATIAELAASMGCSVRTVQRYAEAAQIAGVAEWIHGKGGRWGSDNPGRVRLLNARLRRCA